MQYGNDYHLLPITSLKSGEIQEVTDEIVGLTIQIVNVCFVKDTNTSDWVLVDAGMPGSAESIISTCNQLFGVDLPPKAIILTHGHFDHVGAIIELVKHWGVPVYAHELEMPYLTGIKSYDPPHPEAEGLIAKMSIWFPREPIDLGNHVKILPTNGTVPFLPKWKWIHTPGHTPGHISLFKEEDRSLIAGDAFVTVKQESIYKVIKQEIEISGPPKYFTPDWQSARESVIKLEALKPAFAITGHGMPVSGKSLNTMLSKLVSEFDQIGLGIN